MKVKIKKWHAVATWRWDFPEDEKCGICHSSFDTTCSACKYPGDECSVLMGQCNHSFHMHCVLKWIQQESSKGTCPMCRGKFEAKTGTNGAQEVAAIMSQQRQQTEPQEDPE